VTTHSSYKSDPRKKRLCPVCLHWDPRPEDMSGPGIGYCIERDIVTMIRYECEHFEEATKSKVAARERELYGDFEDEEQEDED
jgi:hypothetical protein